MTGMSNSTRSVQNRGRISLENCFEKKNDMKNCTTRNSSIVFGSAHDIRESQKPNFSLTKQISVMDEVGDGKRYRKSTNSLRSRLGQSYDFATDGNIRFQSVLSR